MAVGRGDGGVIEVGEGGDAGDGVEGGGFEFGEGGAVCEEVDQGGEDRGDLVQGCERGKMGVGQVQVGNACEFIAVRGGGFGQGVRSKIKKS